MSIRSKIAWTALGCVLLSGAANGAEPGKADPKKDRPFKSDKTPGRSADAPAASTPADGSAPVDPATSGQAATASAFQQLACLTVQPPEGTPAGRLLMVMNPTASTLPVGTVVWLSPVSINGENDIVMISPGVVTRVDGTSASMDRYMKLPSALAPGGSHTLLYSPDPPWPGCSADPSSAADGGAIAGAASA
jgi:hypothetical protein